MDLILQYSEHVFIHSINSASADNTLASRIRFFLKMSITQVMSEFLSGLDTALFPHALAMISQVDYSKSSHFIAESHFNYIFDLHGVHLLSESKNMANTC